MIVHGNLRSLGTPSRRVTITSNFTNPAPHSWRNITIKSTGRAEIYNTDMSYGEVAIKLYSDWNRIEDSKFLRNWYGVFVYSSHNRFLNASFERNEAGMVFTDSSSHNTVYNSTVVLSRGGGIHLGSDMAGTSEFMGSTIWGNQRNGISIRNTQGWEVSCNLISSNGLRGIDLVAANASIHHNNIMNNSDNGYDTHNWASWDTGVGGNYWDDYGGADIDGDGIGDTPYQILPENQDNYPFMDPIPSCPGGIPVGQLPVAVARPTNQTVHISQSAWFNGSNSSDPDGWIVSYYWDFGDGDSAWGMNVSHQYSAAGQFTVGLKVTDNDGNTDWDYVTVTVWADPPVSDAGPDQVAYVGQTVVFNGSDSYDPDGVIIEWEWSFGDGHYDYGEIVTHIYYAAGNYTVTLWVTDNDNFKDSDTAIVTILPALQPPIPVINGPYFGRKNFPVNFTAIGSYDPDGSIVDLEWDFGDGSPTAHGWNVSHTYSSGGNYTVTLTATDNDNLTATNTTLAYIEDESPGAPSGQNAALGGGNLDDVMLGWSLSPDDGSIENDVVGYEIHYGTSYDSGGAGYTLLDTVPAGSTSYTHVGGGQSDTHTYFYIVKAVDDAGQEAFGRQTVKFARHMPVGMQLISVPVIMSDTSVQTVFQTVDFNRVIYYDAMAGKRHNWKTFDTRKPYSSLTDVDETMALWVDVKTDGYLVTAGLVPLDTTIRLVVGWNFVGYASFIDRMVGDTFSGAIYQNVEGFDPMDPPWYLLRLSATDVLSFGRGYWIHVSEEFDWTVTN
jgi:PKD repeat protein